jgi:putative hydrolase of the HAD superfamily
MAHWLRARLGLTDVSLDDFEDVLWRSTIRLVLAPGVDAVLTRLASDGVPVAAVSNASFSGRVMTNELVAHGVGDRFAFVLTSADAKHRKPASAIFHQALGLLGMRASDVWFVGDTWDDDIIGAQKAGLVPLWLYPSATPRDGVLEVTTVRDWSAMMERYAAACASHG